MKNKIVLYIFMCLVVFTLIIIVNHEAGLLYNLIIITPGAILAMFLIKLSQPINSGTSERTLTEEKEYERYLRRNDMDRRDFEAEIKKIISSDKSDKISQDTNKVLDEKIITWHNKELDLCDEFVKNNPKNMHAINRRAQLYDANGRYYDAINDYRYLMRKKPKEVSYVRDCAVMYAKLNDIDTACLLINNFYKKKRNDEYYAILGKLFDNAEKYELAIENYTKAIELNPKNGDYYHERGYIYLKMGDRIKSQKDFNKSTKILEADYMELQTKYALTENNISTYKSSDRKFTICMLALVLAITFASEPMITSPTVSNIVTGSLIIVVTFAVCVYVLVRHGK